MTSAFRFGSLTHFPGFGAGIVRPLMRPEGTGSSRIMLMGEALGEHEERDGLPFRPQAEAGSVLERALHRAGLPRESLTITNLVWYRPPRNWLDGAPWQSDAIRACAGFNAELVALRQPKVIVALGGLAMAELTGLAGEKAGILNTRGFVVPSLLYPGVPIVGTYHPSFLRRGSKERQEAGAKGKTEAAGGGTQGMALLGVLIRDLLLAQQIVRDGAPRFEYDSYALGASLEDWRSALEELKRSPGTMISYDFETIDTFAAADESEAEIIRREPTQVQISWRPRQALVSSWTPELVPILRALLELPNPKIDWNGRKFDRPILRELGIRTDLGAWHDGMDLWHHAQPDLPRGLQFATSFHVPEVGPWKHLSLAAPLWYGALDADMPLRIYASLRATLSQTREAHSGVTLFEGYEDQVVHVAPVLDRMTVRGIPVDEDERLALDAEFAQTLIRTAGECQALVPDELKPLSPKNGFVRTPAELLRECPECGGKKKLDAPTDPGEKPRKRAKKIPCGACGGKGQVLVETLSAPFVLREFEIEVKCDCEWSKPFKAFEKSDTLPVDCFRCSNQGKVKDKIQRWARLEEFKPGSWQQVLRYIEFRMAEDIERRAKKRFARSGDPEESRMWAEKTTDWYVPWNDRENRPTTAAVELERLARRTGDALLPKVLEYKEIATARGTFVEGWKPGADGRVHANFGFKPATPQLSCVAPWTPVLTKRGVLPIGRIEIGDEVWTHQNRWRRVQKIWIKGREAMFDVELSNGKVLTCTASHRMLLWSDEHVQKTNQRSIGDLESIVALSRSALSDGERYAKGTTDSSDHIGHNFEGEFAARGVSGDSTASLLAFEDGSEESNDGKTSPQLEGFGFRWTRVSDLLEEWKEAVCASRGNGGSVGDAGVAGKVRRASYRSKSAKQRTRQSGFAYAVGASGNSLSNGGGFIKVGVQAIHSVGDHEVYDITVEDDGSYLACGVFSHNSDSPNVQNFPNHSDLAQRMKRMIRASGARRFVKFDWKSFHVVTGGFEAQDAQYIRIARIDMHSFLTLVGLLKLEEPEVAFGWSDSELKERLAWHRKQPKQYAEYARTSWPGGMTFGQIRDYIAKRVVFGWEFGQGAYSLWKLWQETFASPAEAGKCQEVMRSLFPKLDQWQFDVRMRADRDHQLVTRFGHVRRFWDVFERRPVGEDYQPRGNERVWIAKSNGTRWLLKPGDDHEAVVAYLPASDAFGMKRRVLRRLGELGWDSRYGLVCDVHDDLRFETERVDECIADVKPLMEARCEALIDPVVAPEGLWVEAEAAVGKDWASWVKVG